MLSSSNDISIFTGHYGSGKTNTAINYALFLASKGEKVTIIDLDIVNPYFRTSDHADVFENMNIELISPVYARTNVETVALSPKIDYAIRDIEKNIVIDVGGDDAGAVALARYAPDIRARGYQMFFVINENRYLSSSADKTFQILKEIENRSLLKATHLVNNTNIGKETSFEDIALSDQYAQEMSSLSHLAIAFTCVKKDIVSKCNSQDIFPVDIFVNPVWEKSNF
ncbi:MAG: hypothetical protein K0R90_1036 [Oscillospiraceae bacterium]|nr:hypothetical protein [Oscillospiraceae bacterium]